MTITLSEELAERLRAVAGTNANWFAVAAIERAIESSGQEEMDIDDELTEAERLQTRAGLERGLADSDAGRVASAEAFYKRMYAKHGVLGAESGK